MFRLNIVARQLNNLAIETLRRAPFLAYGLAFA